MNDAEQNAFRRDIVVVGASSGALQALKFIADVPPDLPAAIFVVVHAAADGPGLLPDIISTYSPLPVAHARDGEPIEPGRIYVAPPDYHVVIQPGFVQVARGPRENRHRPSIDVLFRSATESYGRRVVGVVLSGMLDDGSSGLAQIRARGGLGIVQDPTDALFPDMPSNALAQAGADYCVMQSGLAALLAKAVSHKLDEQNLGVTKERSEARAGEVSMNSNEYDGRPGSPSNFSCPDCGGVLRQEEEAQSLRFRCRVGHAFSANALLSAQSDGVEQALWSALRALEEKAEMARRLKQYALQRNFQSAPHKFEQEAKKLEADAAAIRKLLKNTEGSEAF
jgi:two-component system chemotaxis response regulator CheB